MADVLIIDDAPLMRLVLTRILARAGHTVREADDGRSGIAEFQDHRPELVITDMMMSEMDGIETIRAMRREDPKIPIIAISGGDGVNWKSAAALGATATLEKPFALDEMLALVERLLIGSYATT
jgi:DNA-binding NtrC family response regulator